LYTSRSQQQDNSSAAPEFTDKITKEYVFTVTRRAADDQTGGFEMKVVDDSITPTVVKLEGTRSTADNQTHAKLRSAENKPVYLGFIISGVEAEISSIVIKQGADLEPLTLTPAVPAATPTPLPPVESVAITNGEKNTVNIGSGLQMTATVTPEDADTRLTWSVDPDDGSIATITAAGVLTGVELGTVTVYATSVADPTKKSEGFVVTVQNAPEVLENNRSWNFQTVPAGWTDNTNTVAGIGDTDYGQGMTLKSDTRTMKVDVTRAIPAKTDTVDTTGWSTGVLQQGGVGTTPHFATIREVQGPFTLTFNYSGTGNSGTDLRRIKVKIGEAETDPGEDYAVTTVTTPKTWMFTYSGTDKVDVELHGVVNSVRLFDLILTYTGQ
jgi:hypothetical protein